MTSCRACILRSHAGPKKLFREGKMMGGTVSVGPIKHLDAAVDATRAFAAAALVRVLVRSLDGMSLEYAFALSRDVALAEERAREGGPVEHTWERLASSKLLAHNRNGPVDDRADRGGGDGDGSDSEVESIASDDMGHASHSQAAELAMTARNELVNAVDFFLQWKDALVESYPLPNAALLPLLTIASQLLRCRDILGNNIATLCKLARSFAKGLLSDEHVHRLKIESEQARLMVGIERGRRIEATRKTSACLALLRRMDNEIRYVRWYRLFLKLRQRDSARHATKQIDTLRATVQNLKGSLSELRKALKGSKDKQIATAKVAVKNQKRADTLQRELKRAEKRERKLTIELKQVSERLNRSFQERDALQQRNQEALDVLPSAHAGPRRSGVINDNFGDDDGISCEADSHAADIASAAGEPGRKLSEVESSLNDHTEELRRLTQTPEEVKTLFQSEEETEAAMQAAVEAAINEKVKEVAAVRAQEERMVVPLQKRRESMGLAAQQLESEVEDSTSFSGTSHAAPISLEQVNDSGTRAPDKRVLTIGTSKDSKGKSTTSELVNVSQNTNVSEGVAMTTHARSPTPLVPELQSQSEVQQTLPSSHSGSPIVRAARASSERRNRHAADTEAKNISQQIPTAIASNDLPIPAEVVDGEGNTSIPVASRTSGADVPLNIVTQLNEAHANELIQIRRTHAQQVETLKLTMATLQEKLIRRGRELAKLRQSKENFKKRFEPAALFGKSSKTASIEANTKSNKKKKARVKKPASRRKSGTSVKFSSENGFGDMSDVVTPWSVKEGASSRPETTISMAISRASTSEGHGNNGAQQHKLIC
eukprot:g423.t1